MSFAVDLLTTLVNIFVAIFNAIVRFFAPTKKSVKGELALITGGASGIGRLMALRLAKLGANLVVWDINEAGLNKLKGEVSALGVKINTYVVDISKRENIYEAAKKVQKEVGNVTILINNAGIVSGKKFLETPDEKIEATFNINTTAHFWMLKAFLPSMWEKNHGHVVTIASNAGMVGVAGLVDYCASKFAVFGLDEALRFEFKKMKKSGLHTTCVCPYYINTGMFDGVKTKYDFMLPILDPDYVVDKIIHAILVNQEVLVLPRFSWTSVFLRSILPTAAFDLGVNLTGANSSMDDFKGRTETKKTQ